MIKRKIEKFSDSPKLKLVCVERSNKREASDRYHVTFLSNIVVVLTESLQYCLTAIENFTTHDNLLFYHRLGEDTAEKSLIPVRISYLSNSVHQASQCSESRLHD